MSKKRIKTKKFDALYRDSLLESDPTFAESVGILTERCRRLNRENRQKEKGSEAALFRRLYPALVMSALRRAGLSLGDSLELMRTT